MRSLLRSFVLIIIMDMIGRQRLIDVIMIIQSYNSYVDKVAGFYSGATQNLSLNGLA